LFFKDQMQLFAETAAADGVAPAFSPWARTLGFAFVSTMAELPNPMPVAATFAVLFLLPVQRALNEMWAIEQPGLPMRQRFSAGEIALLAACGVLWVLLIALSLIGDSVVVAATR
jgi:hypothetical protein